MHRQVRVAAAKLKFDLSAALPPPPPQTIDFEHFSISSTPSFLLRIGPVLQSYTLVFSAAPFKNPKVVALLEATGGVGGLCWIIF